MYLIVCPIGILLNNVIMSLAGGVKCIKLYTVVRAEGELEGNRKICIFHTKLLKYTLTVTIFITLFAKMCDITLKSLNLASVCSRVVRCCRIIC